MSFAYTTIKTETLEEGKRTYLGYNVGTAGVLLNTRLCFETPAGVPIRESELYLPGDTVSGLVSGMSGSPFTTLKTETLANGVVRTLRAYTTPGGNILLHDFMQMTVSVSGKTRVTYAEEHFKVIEAGSLSGTDLVKAPRRGKIGTSGAATYGSQASWQDILVAPAGAVLQLSVPAILNDVLEANLVFSAYNNIGVSMQVDVRITLDGNEVAWCRQQHDATGSDRNYSIRGSYVIPSTGTHTLKAQVYMDEAEFDQLIQHYGAERGKLEYRLFYP